MRILHVTQRYWPAGGGAETYMREISERLAADGHEVTVATTDALDFELFWQRGKRRIAEPEGWHQGVRILRFPVRHLPGVPLMYSAWRRGLWLLSALRPVPALWIGSLARMTPWAPDLWRWLRATDEQFDLVAGMTICFEPLLEAARQFAKRRGVPYVVYPLTHLGAGKRPGEDALGRFYTMRHQLRIVRGSDAVVTMTPTEARFYESKGVPSDRLHAIGAGINPSEVTGGDAERFRRMHGVTGPIVVCLGTLTYDKGTVHTIEAMRRLWRKGSQATLAMAGTVLDSVTRQLDSLAPEEREHVLLLGRISEEDKQDLLTAADLLVMPSRTDSFGIVYLEAWAYGKPVIGARTWGIGDVIQDGQDGLLVPFGDVPALEGALARLLGDPAASAAMGARGRRKVLAECTWDARYARLRTLYAALTGS